MSLLTAARSTTDPLRLYDRLDDREREVVERVRRFVDDRVLPLINQYWERAEFPFELVPDLAGLGVIGTAIRGHGCPGLSPLAAGLVALEMSRGDGSINTFLGVQSGLAMGTIDLLGSTEQKERWLPPMARLEKIGAFALTEPDHGSDSVALETSATRVGDEYVLAGAKRWIGNGHIADVVVLWARDTADDKVKAFIIEKGADGRHPAGYRTEVITGKIGKRAILQPDIVLDDVRVPAANLLARSTSFRDASAVLARTRSGASWEATGHAMASYEIAVEYARTRVQFGKPLGAHQIVQQRLAKMLAEITAMQLMCFRLAELQEQGSLTGPMASIAKMFTAERGRWVCSEARDILGGNGLLLENHVARHLTDMEVVYTYEGTDTVQSLIIGREITGMSAFR
ncbi:MULTISPECIES: acyl-CoA dehydrogenase family protein [unclassified Microbacterium]|uniref:acyl-CoA dehydrogenase family protein n=1 Tax=unclassified Microbacterium TaxID=2609290 RepID=UPI00160551B6|nr:MULTISPECIES: acyl-CoA dehydrogenase family protein [unclassified Microbacterium]QNA93904.1 acyl-CoA dehydrogenase [Microbacterium sp. Se63.02b]QYM64211.1 acyl-CoA dehydrogenase family protein [Microbacterium sp. Se5.02b]